MWTLLSRIPLSAFANVVHRLAERCHAAPHSHLIRSCEHDISDSASSNSRLDRLVPENSSRSCLLKVQPHLTQVEYVKGGAASKVPHCKLNTIPLLQRCVFDREVKPDLRTEQHQAPMDSKVLTTHERGQNFKMPPLALQ